MNDAVNMPGNRLCDYCCYPKGVGVRGPLCEACVREGVKKNDKGEFEKCATS